MDGDTAEDGVVSEVHFDRRWPAVVEYLDWLGTVSTEALRRIAEAPSSKWCAEDFARRSDCARCLVGHAEDWHGATARDRDLCILSRDRWSPAANAFDLLVQTHGLALTVPAVQAAARERLPAAATPTPEAAR